MSSPKRISNFFISIFVILWTLVFHYESTRFFYLNPLFQRNLPKLKFLFPPAGWIMFFNVDEAYGFAEVYGVKAGKIVFLDPHQILLTRAVGYDNIHRNVLSTVLGAGTKDSFCKLLKKRFPMLEDFIITAVEYPSVTRAPQLRLQQIVYRCEK